MPSTRRRFFHLIGAAAAAGSWSPPPRSLRARARPIAPAAPDEAFWRVVKSQFPVRDGLVMMNAANLCPSPYPVIDAVAALTRSIDADASFQNRAPPRPDGIRLSPHIYNTMDDVDRVVAALAALS